VGAGQRTPPATLRELPAVHELAAALQVPHELGVAAARRAIQEHRETLLSGRGSRQEDLLARARELVDELTRPSLRRVINATGVILHTNLGRAPMPEAARRALASVAEGYSNLELDLERGARGSRQAHVEQLLRDLTGADAALVVNNGAAAVLLAVAALAPRGRAVLVSRGELVEIGGGFRIPEVIAQSGAHLIEVGTTNRTRLADYRRAIERAEVPPAAILHVHQSNFRTVGFVEEVPVGRLCQLGLPVIDDAGSGALADPASVPALTDEPSIAASVAAGSAVVCCSGDKLLGGPQAGLLVGIPEAIGAAREHPLARAVRIDKLSLAALEATLTLYREPERARAEIPTLAMLTLDSAELEARAERLAMAIGSGAETVACSEKVGGGALPLLELEGRAVALPGEPETLARRLRQGDPAVLCHVQDNRALLHVRTVGPDELDALAAAARYALA
jgi:L-seryl-tRNA(Ser) seleniumtransferase